MKQANQSFTLLIDTTSQLLIYFQTTFTDSDLGLTFLENSLHPLSGTYIIKRLRIEGSYLKTA
ncbi:hypothetical protein [Shewanella benthica]|uniref:Branched-chain amino acid aminotransferase n=1 Tax=Shewanella benthica KT99 TaxID=314608 RepID=A9CWD5_9GAMM|nr:hypothetical protein [Shewanella benthica]EDQ02514.1 branched-chain amino acid aminotransferase [Shewanella benthica KT99]